jgi:hypothetical protein
MPGLMTMIYAWRCLASLREFPFTDFALSILDANKVFKEIAI